MNEEVAVVCGGVRCAVVCGVRCAVCGVQCAVWLCWGGRSVVSVSGSYCGRCGCTQIAGGERRAAVRVRASVVGGRWVIGGVVVGGDWWVVIGVWLVVGVMKMRGGLWVVGGGWWAVGGGRWVVVCTHRLHQIRVGALAGSFSASIMM